MIKYFLNMSLYFVLLLQLAVPLQADYGLNVLSGLVSRVGGVVAANLFPMDRNQKLRETRGELAAGIRNGDPFANLYELASKYQILKDSLFPLFPPDLGDDFVPTIPRFIPEDGGSADAEEPAEPVEPAEEEPGEGSGETIAENDANPEKLKGVRIVSSPELPDLTKLPDHLVLEHVLPYLESVDLGQVALAGPSLYKMLVKHARLQGNMGIATCEHDNIIEYMQRISSVCRDNLESRLSVGSHSLFVSGDKEAKTLLDLLGMSRAGAHKFSDFMFEGVPASLILKILEKVEGLKALDISDSDLVDLDVPSLVSNSKLLELEHLLLDCSCLGAKGLCTLMQSPLFMGLRGILWRAFTANP